MPTENACLILYSAQFRIVWISGDTHVAAANEIVGRYPWDFFGTQIDRTNFQAAMLNCLASHLPQDVDIRDITGTWWRARLWSLPFPEIKIAALAVVFPERLWTLTDREREICSLIAGGQRVKQIASNLDVARSTVDNHKANIAAKLRIDSASLDAWCGAHKNWLHLKPPDTAP